MLVLGSPGNPDGSPGPIEEFRVRAGVEAYRRYACGAIILAGGNPHSVLPEAVTMARAAEADGVDETALALDARSRTTWENVKNALAVLPQDEELFIASDATHAWRAKTYLCAQRRDLCGKAHLYTRWEPSSIFWYRWRASYYNVYSIARDGLKRSITGKLEW